MTLPYDYVHRLYAVLAANSESFTTLAILGGLNSATSFRGADLRRVDFGTDDVSGYDFSEADLTQADFSKADGIQRALFHGAKIDGVLWPPGLVQQSKLPGYKIIINGSAHRAHPSLDCCYPVPGDEIIGVNIPGKGLTIHMMGCQTLSAFSASPERFADVEWGNQVIGEGDVGAMTRISVISSNEPTALATITNAIAKQDGTNVILKVVNAQQDFMEVLVDVKVRDIPHLSKVIVGLRGLKVVKGAERM